MSKIFFCFILFSILIVSILFYITLKNIIIKYANPNADTNIEIELEFFKLFKIKINLSQFFNGRNYIQDE